MRRRPADLRPGEPDAENLPPDENGPRRGIVCEGLGFFRRDLSGNRRWVLADINARFPPGAISLIIGPNGSGKSTLLQLLAGLARPSKGLVRADGEPVSRWVTAHLDQWRRQVGFCFQSPPFFNDLTVMENVLAPLIPRPMTLAEMRRRAAAALERTAAAHLAPTPVAALSGGERQRVAMARALAAAPRFLFADEPTAHQDPDGVSVMAEALTSAAAAGAVVVVASHDTRLMATGLARYRHRLNEARLMPDLPDPPNPMSPPNPPNPMDP